MRLLEFYNKVDNSVGVAKILFNFLSNKYPLKKIRDIAKTTSGGTPNRSISIYYGGNIPWIKSGELNDGLIKESEETITEDALKNSSAKLYPKGTLVLALYGATVGKTGILGFESASNQAVCAIYPEKGISKEYLFWFFRQKRFEYIQQSFGGAQPNISQDVVKNTDVPIPPIGIQESVQKLLFHIEKTKKFTDVKEYSTILPQLKEFMLVKEGSDSVKDIYSENFDIINNLRKTILSEAVQGKLVKQDPKDEPASELLKKIKAKKANPYTQLTNEDNSKPIPPRWMWIKFGNLVDFSKKYPMKRGPFGSSITKSIFVPKGEDTFKVYEQKNAIYNDPKLGHYYINKNNFEKLKAFEVEGGDIIISCSGTIGKIGFLPENTERGIINQALLKLCINEEVLLKKYFGFLFEAYMMKSEKLTNLKGTAMKNIPAVKVLQNMPIPLPPLSEQKRIVEKVDKLMTYCDELERQVKESQNNSEMLMESILKESFQ